MKYDPHAFGVDKFIAGRPMVDRDIDPRLLMDAKLVRVMRQAEHTLAIARSARRRRLCDGAGLIGIVLLGATLLSAPGPRARPGEPAAIARRTGLAAPLNHFETAPATAAAMASTAKEDIPLVALSPDAFPTPPEGWSTSKTDSASATEQPETDYPAKLDAAAPGRSTGGDLNSNFPSR